MIDVDRVIFWFVMTIAFVCVLMSGVVLFQNHRLVRSNAELSHFIDSRLDSLEIVQARLTANQLAGFEALRLGVGSRVADSIMRSVEK